MKLLLDTHVLLWLLNGDRLNDAVRHALAEPTSAVFVSIVSLWEIVAKRRIGKLEADIGAIAAQMAPASKLQWLGISQEHLLALDRLPLREQHRAPFDHRIIAQAISDGMTLVTRDRNAGLYPVAVMAA
jgi:PIN domain nuclease of toxin-antitoxin system